MEMAAFPVGLYGNFGVDAGLRDAPNWDAAWAVKPDQLMRTIVADLSLKLFHNAELLHRYLRNNCIAAAVFFPIVVTLILLNIRASPDILFFSAILVMESFYGACRNAFHDDSPWAMPLCMGSAAIWSVFGLLLGASTLAARVRVFGS